MLSIVEFIKWQVQRNAVQSPHDFGMYLKLDGVGPVDNRPSPNKLHPFVKKKL